MPEIRNRDLEPLTQALRSLDGTTEAVRVSNGLAVVVVPFKLRARVRLLIAQWLTAMRVQREALNTVRNALVKAHAAPETPAEVIGENVRLFNEDWEEVLSETFSVPLPLLNPDDLLGDDSSPNRILPTALSDLSPALAPPVEPTEPTEPLY